MDSIETNRTATRRKSAAQVVAPRRPRSLADTEVRGWLVVAEDGHRIGRVHDLAHDGAATVEYVQVAVDTALRERTGGDRLVIPAACLRVSAHRRCVNLRGTRSDDLAHAPRVASWPRSTDQEHRLRRFYRLAEPRA